jgi:TusE/DsrC/DsvC family sulfur relay protein
MPLPRANPKPLTGRRLWRNTMEMVELGGKQIEIDEDGFIQDPDAWDEAVAKDLAKTEGVDELTDNHWKLVNYLREYYLEYNMAPMIRKLCKQTGFSLKEVYDLFPSGPAMGACKVAGLPKPTGCV